MQRKNKNRHNPHKKLFIFTPVTTSLPNLNTIRSHYTICLYPYMKFNYRDDVFATLMYLT